MKHYAFFYILLFSLTATAAKVDFTSQGPQVLHFDAPASSGLSAGVFVADGVDGVNLVYTANSTSASVRFLRFSNTGGGYAEPAPGIPTHDGTRWTLENVEGNMGYIIEEGTDRTYLWVVNYATQPLQLNAINPAAEQDCAMAALDFNGSATAIDYFDINGRKLVLSRELTVGYTTLQFDDESFSYRPVQTEETLEQAGSVIHVPAALCPTNYTLSGDRFLKAWGREQSISSPLMEPYAVEAHTKAERTDGEAPDNQSTEGADPTALGGSAPANVTFTAAVTDGAIFTEWQMSPTQDFEEITYRDSNTEFSYTFNELGTTYVRFICDNAAGGCMFTGDTYDVTIGTSSLLCPNAFSPGASEGVNDIWKVSYRSITSFKCTIFDRWGNKIISFDDPAQGWDGRRGGKLVPPGVYYYVIKATGADGKKYDRAGDINIVGYK